ncbi:MAG TPA: adenine deaminase [Ferruginibacter sp.]|nr:adenine deaminase [Chitinophagaceae bacterium]HRI25128.1 adenine deaminase [Ferruginibacter sp.]
MSNFSVQGNIVDILARHIFYGEIVAENGKITSIRELPTSNRKPQTSNHYILPGFIDSHVHVESSMLVPAEFAKLAVVHGTVGTISDPHEIANVCGMEGVEFMIKNGKTVPFKFHFGAPSCVPATVFETAGAALNAEDVDRLLQKEEINYLSEMMNFPGVLFGDEEVHQKIASAKKYGKPVDGHAPGLRGADAKKYIDAGISTDHECFTAEEALDKLNYGMKILIREGSAAKNFEALIGLMHEHYNRMMFCSDDKHPDSLAAGHINQLCARAVAKGIDVFKVLQAACINPVKHYNMNVGLLKEGDAADFIIAENLEQFNIKQTYINGQLVANNGKTLIETTPAVPLNNFDCAEKNVADFGFPITDASKKIFAIEALDGQLITNKVACSPIQRNGFYESDATNDVLKIVVVNRYKNAPVAKAFIKNFGLKQGALASSVAHDSHNIVAVGVDDESLVKAVNLVIKERGGVSAVFGNKEKVLGLPVAGLMSNEDGYQVADAYTAIDKMTKEEMGSTLAAPFMTLSFMALLVIPHLKLSDLGLFDGDTFTFMA